jgi:cell division protein FtsL
MARAATAPAVRPGRPRTAPAPRPRPAQPRRRSGAGVPTRAPRRRRRTAPGIARVLEAPVARMLDALLLGRAWIVLIGVLLAGIVFFNVSLLGLNQGITQDAERAQTLQQQNAQLRLQVAGLASTERTTQLAAKKGLVMPAAGEVGYLHSHVRSDAHHALARIVAPNQLAAGTTATGTVATPTQTATPTPTPTPAAAVPVATPVPAASQQAPTGVPGQ